MVNRTDFGGESNTGQLITREKKNEIILNSGFLQDLKMRPHTVAKRYELMQNPKVSKTLESNQLTKIKACQFLFFYLSLFRPAISNF